ncbi:MAG: hypothetical protein ACO1OB_30780 [Archangium sp.]
MAKFDAVTQRGLKALALAARHAAVLDARLPAGHVAALQANLTQLGAAVPDQKAVRADAQQASQSQKETFKKLVALLTALRTSVKHDEDANDADKKAWGVGIKLDVESPKRTLAAAQSVLKVAKAKPERAAQLSVFPDDIAKLEALHAAAVAADDEENVKRATAPLSTKARNALQKSVIAAVKKIAGAGVVAFALDATVRADFEALLERG